MHWVLVFLGAASFGGDVGKDTAAGHDDAAPTLSVERVSFGENGEEDREYFASSGDGGRDKRVEVGNGVENERLSDRGTCPELDDFREDTGVRETERGAANQFAPREGEDDGGDEHVGVGPEHVVVGFRDDASFLCFGFDAFLDAARARATSLCRRVPERSGDLLQP